MQQQEHHSRLSLMGGLWEPNIWGFPKIRGTILGVPIIRIIVIIVGSILGFLYFGRLPYKHLESNKEGCFGA